MSDEYREISFFTTHGYHVAIPEGLFRSGYPVSHYIESQGELGLRDIDQLRDVMKHLLVQQISSDKICVMGHSYGGFCAAHLANDQSLVKASVIQSAALDLQVLIDLDPSLKGAVIKNEKNPIDLSEHLSKISPSLGASYPQVPILVSCAINDARCPIDQTRRFVDRVLKKMPNHPLVYLEGENGGHGNMFDRYDVLLSFFQNVLGKHAQSDIREYKLVKDTINFFKQQSLFDNTRNPLWLEIGSLTN